MARQLGQSISNIIAPVGFFLALQWPVPIKSSPRKKKNRVISSHGSLHVTSKECYFYSYHLPKALLQTLLWQQCSLMAVVSFSTKQKYFRNGWTNTTMNSRCWLSPRSQISSELCICGMCKSDQSYEVRLRQMRMQLCARVSLLILIIAHLNKWSIHSNLCKSIIEPLAVNTIHLIQITIRLPQLLVSCTVYQFSFQIQLLYYVKSRLVSDRLINPHWTVWMH